MQYSDTRSPVFVSDMFTVMGGAAPAPVGWRMMVRVKRMPLQVKYAVMKSCYVGADVCARKKVFRQKKTLHLIHSFKAICSTTSTKDLQGIFFMSV